MKLSLFFAIAAKAIKGFRMQCPPSLNESNIQQFHHSILPVRPKPSLQGLLCDDNI